jgi:small-conductance mechanosensitive channel
MTTANEPHTHSRATLASKQPAATSRGQDTLRCSSCQATMLPDEAFHASQGLVCPACHCEDELDGSPGFQPRPRAEHATSAKVLSFIVDISLFVILLFVVGAPFWLAFFVSGVAGWAIRSAMTAD